MTYTGYRFDGLRAVLVRPSDSAQAVSGDTWARDRSNATTNDGTEVTATFLNRLKASLEALAALGDALGDGDDQLANSVETFVGAAIAAASAALDSAKLNKSGGTMTGALTLSGDASSALHPVTKQQFDNALAGLDPKASVKCATTANITLSGEQTIDGITTSASRVLVKNQSSASQNGIYVSAAGAWSRATDMDAWTEVPGALVLVEEGSTNADTGYVCSADVGGTLGSTSIAWSKFCGTGTFQALSALLTSISGLSMVADRMIYGTGTDAVALATLTAAGRAILDDVDAAAQRVTLGLAIGTHVQAYDAQLFSNIPQNSQGAAYTLVLTDGGKHIFHPSADTTARIWTIPANASVAFPVGTAITFINQNSGGVITIAITTDTMRLAGAGTTGSRTLAANGVATAIKVTTTEWIISGTGLT